MAFEERSVLLISESYFKNRFKYLYAKCSRKPVSYRAVSDCVSFCFIAKKRHNVQGNL